MWCWVTSLSPLSGLIVATGLNAVHFSSQVGFLLGRGKYLNFAEVHHLFKSLLLRPRQTNLSPAQLFLSFREIGTSFVETSKSVYIKAEQLGYWSASNCSILAGQRRPCNSANTNSKRPGFGAGDSAYWRPSCDL